mgnify:CR=1 FL=1
MAKQDFYDVLGVAQNSSADEIKKAYRKKAMQYHPDRNQGDDAAEQKFKEAGEAYDILKDDQKRAAYDQYGHAAFEGNAAPPPAASRTFLMKCLAILTDGNNPVAGPHGVLIFDSI